MSSAVNHPPAAEQPTPPLPEFQKVGADEAGPQWISISAMLSDLADAQLTRTDYFMGVDLGSTSAVEV
ncbi:hypothetical protein [Rhodococcoides kyotonense]|uniref:hypothetical protein n=1 Tax=Rhodococcoides kyotonense TaxID=398843 RepID=UPI0011300CAD|nr:hypothetical protein [Rhodococcus kyotonensis]